MNIFPLSMGSPLFDPSTRQPAGGAKAYFYMGSTTTPLRVTTTDDGSTPLPWPVVADASGILPPIFIPYGPYGYRLTTATGSTIGNTVSLVQNPAPPASGGGGGIIVTQDQIFQTGDPKWVLRRGTMSGWVLMNGGTIGNAGSGGTLRANADASALFTYLFDNLPDAYAPVSGGRTTASADFAAGKTIVVPTMAGYLAGCVDDLGGSAANRLQRSTTISTTNANTSATVADATGLSIGMFVMSANVAAGTTIADISGTTITLSGNASATASGTAVRFSMIEDAQVVGATGGIISKIQALKEMAQHNHGGATTSDGQHQHAFAALFDSGASAGPGVGAGQGGTPSNSSTQPAGLHSHGIPNAGSSLPMGILPPMRQGSWYMKL